MEKEEWNIIESIVDQVMDLPVQERSKKLNRLCSDNPDLKSRVLQMLDSIEKSDPFIEQISESKNNLFSDVEHEHSTFNEECLIGDTIDKYKIEKKIGKGGMGTVFLASRCDGIFDKNVAIKLLRREFAVPAIKLQFKLERQILANLKHPGIARLYDGGIYRGLPYLVMEYVKGEPIDKYCNAKKLSVHERINLFKSVLNIVQYAHNNLVIHRDLKPENILITNDGKVKILDFGISQLEIESSETSDLIPQKHFLTPAFASPEQMSGKQVVTSSDIYSLGLLLQQLLVNHLPFDFDSKKIDEIRDVKLAGNPSKLSQSFSLLSGTQQNKIAKQCNTSPKNMVKRLKSDLDQIILKCLQPSPEERYSTIGLFLSDLNSYQNKYPVSAVRNTFFYKSAKFFERNLKPVSAAAVIVIFISAASVYSVHQIKEEHQLAMAETQKAEEMSTFLIDLFEAADPTVTQNSTMDVKDLLYQGLERIDNISDPEIKASMLTVMGDALIKISDYETAEKVLINAVDENSKAFGENSLFTADAIFTLGLKHSRNSMWHLALPEFRKSYDIYSEQLDAYHHKVIKSLSKFGLSLLNNGKQDSAKFYIETAYERMQNTREPNSPELLNTMVDYAYFLGSTGSHEQGIEVLQNVIQSYLEFSTDNDHRLIQPYHYLAISYRHIGEYERSIENYKKALSISEDVHADGHLTTRRIRMNLINPLTRLERHDRVKFHYERNIELMEGRFSYYHWRTGQAFGSYGGYFISQENFEKAISLYEKNLDIYQQTIGPDHIWTAFVEGVLSALYRFTDQINLAEELFDKHLEIYRERYPDYNNDHTSQIRRIIRIYEEADGDYGDFINMYTPLLE